MKDLRRDGYPAENLRGGLRAWMRANLPLEPREGRILLNDDGRAAVPAGAGPARSIRVA